MRNDATGLLLCYGGLGLSSLHTVLFFTGVSLIKQAVSRKDRPLFCFRREGLRDMLKRQLSYFLLQECIIKKDKEADMGECEKRVEGWFCTARSRFPKAGTANSNVS